MTNRPLNPSPIMPKPTKIPAWRLAAVKKGGANVPAAKRAFSKNKSLASSAGKKGGLNVPPHKRTFAQNPALARAAALKSVAKRKAKALAALATPTKKET